MQIWLIATVICGYCSYTAQTHGLVICECAFSQNLQRVALGNNVRTDDSAELLVVPVSGRANCSVTSLKHVPV
jgi:hypothetical protein